LKIKKKQIPYKKKRKLLDAYENKKYDISEQLSKSYSKEYPFDGFSWKILGLILLETNRTSDALEATKKSLSLDSRDSEVLNNLGLILKKLNKKDEAINYLKQAINLKPDLFPAYKNLGVIFHEQDNFEMAIKYYKKAYKITPDPEIHHLISSIEGKSLSLDNKEYSKKLFDDAASTFDELLVGKLDYKLPKIVSNLLLEINQNNSLGSILDLGCGTGLFGKEIKKFCNYIEGVDISESMLKEALNKKVYNKLVNADIVDYLSKVDLNFDIFISLDTFIYIGDIEEIFQLIVSRNNLKGKFIFSTEFKENDKKTEFILQKSGRFSHSHFYIERLCKEFKYDLKHFEKVKLRKDKKSYIIGGLYVLEF
tara:strand:+ start:52 stop:1152 length:1101 start_codon:yes stop_codon:yes gene_type:complete